MAKNYSVKQSDSTHSIDLSKPDGISIFWNLFSKNNKKENVHNVANKEKPKLKNNSIAMKILKLRGINIEQLEIFNKSDLHPLKENNKLFLIDPNQINLNKKNLLRKNVLLDLLNNKNNLKDSNNFKENFKSSSTVSIKSKKSLINSSMAYLRSKKSIDNAIKNNKKGSNNQNEKDKKVVNMFSSPGIENVLFKTLPEGKVKKTKHKRVLVPVYVGKAKSSKSSNLKKETLLNDNGQSNPLYTGSEIRTMEGELNSLECKTNKIKDTVSWKTLLQVNSPSQKSNYPLKHFYPETDTLITNKIEKKNNFDLTKLQLNKKEKSNILSKKTMEKLHKNKILPDDDTVNKKQEEKSKKRIDNIVDILTNPDVLIKNHKLIIPRDFSQEGMFQANPDAGCDTILKVFKILSEENDYANQLTNTLIRGHRENIMEERKTTNCQLEVRNKVEAILCHGGEKNTITALGTPTNINSANGMNKNLSNMNSDKKINNNELRNIFSLPVNLNILKTLRETPTDEINRSFKKAKSEVDGLTKSLNNFEEEGPCINSDKEEPAFHMEPVSKKSEISIQNLTDNIKKESDSKEFLRQVLKISELIKSKSSEDSSNDININTTNHQLQNSLATFEEELVNRPNCKISVGKINGKDKCNIDMLHLNISHEECEVPGMLKQSQKLLKKTTISCPIKTAEQKVSITILVENDLRDGKKLLSDANPNLVNHSICQFKEITNSKSSLDLKNLHSEKEHISENTVEVVEEPAFKIGNFSHTDSSSLNKKKETDRSNIISSTDNERFVYNQNNGKKTDEFDLIVGGTYMTQEQRKVFDKVLGVGHYEKSINLSNLKLKRQKKDFSSDVNYRPGLINILSESSIGSHESDAASQCKANAKEKNRRKMLNRSGRYYTKNPFYVESSSLKKKSKTIISKEYNSFIKNIETNNHCGCDSLNKIKVPSPLSKENICLYNDYQQLLEPTVKSDFISPIKSLYSTDVRKKLCRFNLTLNQEPVVRQNNFPFLKIIKDDNQIEENKTVDMNHIKVSSYWLNTMTGISKDMLQHFKDYDIKSSTKYQRIRSVQSDSNILQNPRVSFHLCNAKLGVPSVKENFIIDESPLETLSSVGSELKNNHLVSELKSFQYEKGDEVERDNSFNHIYELNPDKNFQQSSEDLLCTIKNSEKIGFKKQFVRSVKNYPLISYKPVQTLSSHNTSKEPDQDILQNCHVEKEIKLNNNKTKLCHCSDVGCLTVISEENFIHDFTE